MLYLARAEMLTKSSLSPDLYLGPEFRKENDRRAALMGGEPDSWPTVKDNLMSPQFRRDYGSHSGVLANLSGHSAERCRLVMRNAAHAI